MVQGPISAPAYLLRAANYAESDQILTLYLRQFGKISCMARGARNSKKRFGSFLRPFCKFEAGLRVSVSQALPLLESAQELNSFPGLLSDLDRMSSGWRLLELLDKLEEPGSAHPEIFDALDHAFGELNHGYGDAGLRCEAKFLALHGWSPRLDICVHCGKNWPFNPTYFSMTEGGLLCGDCVKNRGGAWMALHNSESLALRALFEQEDGPVTPGRAVLTNFSQHQLGLALRTDRFEKSLRSAF